MRNPKNKRLLWIGWDGADWNHIRPLLDQGLLPNLEGLIQRGVSGNLATLQPALSPMLWTSAATGKHAPAHNILGFSEPDHSHGSRPYSSTSRNCMAIWNMLTAKNLKSNVINWWASHPAESINGCVISNLFEGIRRTEKGLQVATGTVHPASKQKHYQQFKVFPEELTSEQLCAFVPLANKIDQLNDSRLDILARTIAEMLTTHSVATAVLEQEEWDFSAVYYTAIDHFCHAFMQYAEPQQSHIADSDFEIFKDVIEACYRFSDMTLGRLLSFCDEETSVVLCSDHGFHSGRRRLRDTPREPAGPAAWHREFGIFVAAGPNIRQSDTLCGASLIDLCPTLLTLLDLPVGRDMDGRPLLEIFREPPDVQWIETWEKYRELGTSNVLAEDSESPTNCNDSVNQDALLQHFENLGYVEHTDNLESRKAAAVTETSFNLARSLAFLRRHSEATEIFEALVEQHPWESRFVSHLASSYFAERDFENCVAMIGKSYDLNSTPNTYIKLLWCECNHELKNYGDLFDSRLSDLSGSTHSGILNRVGRLHLKIRDVEKAEIAFRRSLVFDGDNAEAFSGLAATLTKSCRNEEAMDAAMRAISLIYQKPKAHLYLGIAAARLGQYDRAIIALKNTIELNPQLVQAYSWLAHAYRKSGDRHMAGWYRLEGARMRQRQSTDSPPNDRRESRTTPTPLPESERNESLNEKRPRKRDPKSQSGRTLNIVSGLPRSGTSLMMSMLEAGGLKPKTDNLRTADQGNPNGYFEWEEIKKIKQSPRILDDPQLDDQAIKIVSPLLEHLPLRHRYKTIFMTRPIEEVFASQQKLLEGLSSQQVPSDGHQNQISMTQLEQHRQSVLDYLNSRAEFDLLVIDYHDLLRSPGDVCQTLVDFFGTDTLPRADEMARIIDPRLHRQRRRLQTSQV